MTAQTKPDGIDARRVTTAAAGATVVSLVTLVAGWLVSAWAGSHGESGTWEGLGYFLFGIAVTLVVYLLIAVVSAVVAFTRVLPRRRRWGPILGFVAMALLLPFALYRFGIGFGLDIGTLGAAAVMGAMVAVPVSAAGRLRWRWTGPLLGFIVLCATVLR